MSKIFPLEAVLRLHVESRKPGVNSVVIHHDTVQVVGTFNDQDDLVADLEDLAGITDEEVVSIVNPGMHVRRYADDASFDFETVQ